MEAIERVNAQYQLDKASAVSRGLKAELSKKQKWLMGLLSLSLILAAIVFVYRRRYYKTEEKASHNAQNLQALQAQLSAIQSKIEVQNKSKKRSTQLVVSDRNTPILAQKSTLRLRSKALIKIEDINYLQSEGHYLHIFIGERTKAEVERSSLVAFLKKLPENQFVRVHRSYAVNLSKVRALYAKHLLMQDNIEIPLSRSFKEEFLKRFPD